MSQACSFFFILQLYLETRACNEQQEAMRRGRKLSTSPTCPCSSLTQRSKDLWPKQVHLSSKSMASASSQWHARLLYWPTLHTVTGKIYKSQASCADHPTIYTCHSSYTEQGPLSAMLSLESQWAHICGGEGLWWPDSPPETSGRWERGAAKWNFLSICSCNISTSLKDCTVSPQLDIMMITKVFSTDMAFFFFCIIFSVAEIFLF